MWPYWLLFFLPAWLTVTRLRSGQGQAIRWSSYWQLAFVVLVLMIGLRHEVGGDWGNDWSVYGVSTGSATDVPLLEAIRLGDPAYSLLMWLVRQLGLGIHALDLLSAVPFTWGLIVFCRVQPRPWLALVVAVPYLVTVVAMGYTRQSVAIGLSMLGLVALSQGRVLRFVLWLALAATFHKSAVILLPLAMLAGTRRRLLVVLWVTVATFVLFALLLQESVDKLVVNYIGAEYSSQGAGIRIAMNAMPAVLFLWFRRRFVMPHSDLIFWTWMSLGALAFIGLLAISPSSTAVDRVALYWIPLQLFVLARLPDAMGQSGRKNAGWVYAVVAYSAAVHFVWLVYAATAFAWLPYQFYPWIWLWR
jgi:EpsG family